MKNKIEELLGITLTEREQMVLSLYDKLITAEEKPKNQNIVTIRKYVSRHLKDSYMEAFSRFAKINKVGIVMTGLYTTGNSTALSIILTGDDTDSVNRVKDYIVNLN